MAVPIKTSGPFPSLGTFLHTIAARSPPLPKDPFPCTERLAEGFVFLLSALWAIQLMNDAQEEQHNSALWCWNSSGLWVMAQLHSQGIQTSLCFPCPHLTSQEILSWAPGAFLLAAHFLLLLCLYHFVTGIISR